MLEESFGNIFPQFSRMVTFAALQTMTLKRLCCLIRRLVENHNLEKYLSYQLAMWPEIAPFLWLKYFLQFSRELYTNTNIPAKCKSKSLRSSEKGKGPCTWDQKRGLSWPGGKTEGKSVWGEKVGVEVGEGGNGKNKLLHHTIACPGSSQAKGFSSWHPKAEPH